MNIRKAKNELEFFRDNEPVQTTFTLETDNPTAEYRDITAFTQGLTTYRLFTRISLTASDSSPFYFRIVRDSTVLFEELLDGSSIILALSVISSPESIRLDSGEEIKFQIKQSSPQANDFFVLNLAWITFPI